MNESEHFNNHILPILFELYIAQILQPFEETRSPLK